MKRILSTTICLLLLFSLAMPAFAAGLTVTFTADSLPEVGGTLTVDKSALLDNGSITAEMYNALLEGNVIYSWYKNGTVTQEGTGADALSYELTLSEQGCTIYVKVSFYEDDSFQESKKCGEAISGEITVTSPAPEITTKSLAAATVGTAYYVRLECSDPDAVFSEIMGSQLTEFGLYLTQHGEIEGTPSKAGNCHINVLAVSEGGGENSVSFDLTVNDTPSDKGPDPTQKPTDGTSNPTDGATEPTDNTTETSGSETTGAPTTNGNTDQKNNENKDDGIVLWIILGIVVVLVAGTVVTVVVINKKKSI